MSRRRLAVLAIVFAVSLLVGLDLLRPPSAQLSARLLTGAIGVYQATLSARMPALGVRCRFRPTCSVYAVAAIREDGALVGGVRGVARIARCGPWTPAGTIDLP
jgi:putative membrane protein insertion efficiency factor